MVSSKDKFCSFLRKRERWGKRERRRRKKSEGMKEERGGKRR